MVSSDDPPLPHDLHLVIAFVNTRDIDRNTDQLATPAELARWLGRRSLLASDIELGSPELRQAIDLREALRAALLEHNGEARGAGAHTLERVAEGGRLSVRFGDDGAVRLAPRSGGFAGALAQVLVPIAQASGDRTWERVKACAADDCQWAFYDRSRNRSGRWCDMAVCGNRTKVRTYRTKRHH